MAEDITYDDFGRPVNTPTDPPVRAASTPPTLPTADAALEALAYAQGNPALAAERLNITDPDGASTLLAILALDETIHARAQAIFRFMQLAKLLGALQHVENHLLESLDSLDPKETAKTYTAMVLAAELLTKAATTNPATAGTQNNVTVNLLRLLPTEVREAVRALLPGDPFDVSPTANTYTEQSGRSPSTPPVRSEPLPTSDEP